jgi:hypothetical protein
VCFYVVYIVYFPSTNTTVQGCCDNIFFLSYCSITIKHIALCDLFLLNILFQIFCYIHFNMYFLLLNKHAFFFRYRVLKSVNGFRSVEFNCNYIIPTFLALSK